MLMLERVGREFVAAPGLVKVGVIALVLSLLDDATLHLASGTLLEPIGIGHGDLTPDELAAHLAAFMSMVVIFVGVVADGVRRSRARTGHRT